MLTIAERHHGIPGNVDVVIQAEDEQKRAERRVAHYRRERLNHLAVDAARHGVQLEPENALVWVAWVDDIPGECDLVTDEGCTCRVFRAWHRCEHFALLLRRLGQI